jgi:hypothetical protein
MLKTIKFNDILETVSGFIHEIFQEKVTEKRNKRKF